MYAGNFFGWRVPDKDPQLGLLRRRVVSATNYTVTSADFGMVLEFTGTSNPITVNMPPAARYAGRSILLVHKYATSATIQFTSLNSPANTLDGNSITSIVIPQYGSAMIWSDGNEWRLLWCSQFHPAQLQFGTTSVTFFVATDSTSLSTGSWIFNGGIAVAKNLFHGQKTNGAAYNNASPVNGDLWVHNTSNTWAVYVKGQTQYVRTTLQVERTSAGPSATSTETSLLDGTISLPANWWKDRHAIIIELWGDHDYSATGQYYLSVTLGGTRVLDIPMGVNTAGRWNAKIELVCTATGVSGKIRAVANGGCSNSASTAFQPAYADTTINTTGALTLDVTGRDQPGTTAITITKRAGFIDALTSV